MSANTTAQRLGDFVRIKTGKLDANASDPAGAYPFFTCAREALHIASFSYDCECVLVAGNGDLNVKYYNGKFDAYQRTYIMESSDKQQLDVRFLFHFMSVYVEQLRAMSVGGVIKYIKLGYLTDAQIPIPPITEQRRITEVLDRADDLRAKRQTALNELDSLSQCLFLDLFGDPANNQERWSSCTLGDAVVAIRNGVNAEQRTEPGGWPITRIETISDGTIDLERVRWIEPDDSLIENFQLQCGDILFSHINSVEHIGKAALYTGEPTPLIHGINLLRLRPKLDSVDPVWLLHLLKNDAVRTVFRTRCKRAVNQASLNQPDIKSLAISLPPLALQQDFARRVRAVERLQAKHNASLVELDALFAVLQHRAFNGGL